MPKHSLLIALCCVWAGLGCNPDPVTPDEDINLGGETSVDGGFVTTFQQPAANLSAAEQDLHFDADGAFGAIFVTAPSVHLSGLGPVFNQNSCERCHIGNGRSPFPDNSNDLRGLLFRISVPGTDAHGGNLPVEHFGLQLQNKAVFGVQPEAQISISQIEAIVQYLDGSQAVLHKPVFTVVNPYLPLPADLEISPRMASPVIGLGLVEAIKESDLLALADELDANGDGISGKPNYVWDLRLQAPALGRFGWKASQPTLYQQTAAAYSGDMGITSPLLVFESCFGQNQDDGLSDDAEIDEQTLKTTTFYTQSLGVPRRRNWDDPVVQQGKILFSDLQCGACHHPKFVTGQHEYAFLSNQTIFPYSDFLLHDMGPELADNRPDFRADGREWRTPPLWGIGLTELVTGRTDFLHDGRAHSLEEAILWHGGEAEASKNRFVRLSKSERDALTAFVNSL